MESIKQQGQNQGFLSQVDDKLGSDENINTGEFNDQQDGKMITYRDGDRNDSQGDRILGRKKDGPNIISPAYKISITSNNNIPAKQPHTINLTDVTLKSTIICLLLLSLVMVGVYKMIEQVYEISYPQLVMNKRLTQSRMNSMVRQENSLSKVTQQHLNYQAQNIIKKENQVKQVRQEQWEKIQEGTTEQQKKVAQQNKGVQIQQKEPDSKEISSQDNIQKTQQLPKQQQQHLQVELIKTDQSQLQIVQPKNTNPPEQTKTQTNQQQQTTQQQAVKSEYHEDKGQQAQSQLREKEQFIENYQLKQSEKKKQDQEEQEHAVYKQEEQVKQIEEAKPEDINKNDQSLTQPKEQQKQEVKIPSKPQPPKIQQKVPPRNPLRPSPPHKPQQQLVKPPQRPASSPPVIPTAKANITRQQAIKWRQYEKMIELPLQKQASSDKMLMQEYQYYERKYNISKYNQLPICVVVPTYNNVQNNRYQDNLKSILQQNYTNYHVVIIDDKSSDKTGQKINEYLTTLNPKFSEKIKVIINEQRKMAMPNLRYAAMNQCQENQLFIIVDGDDLLIGRQVFKLFSAVMQQRDYWVMWTNFLSPKGAIGYSRQYPAIHKNSNNYRKAGFVMSHLRAYYTKLFRLIKQQDLQDEKGQYFHAANDVAIGIPILEMAHMHAGYVPQLCYYYNMYTGLNNHKVRLRQQKANDKLIRKKQKYQALQSLDFDKSETK